MLDQRRAAAATRRRQPPPPTGPPIESPAAQPPRPWGPARVLGGLAFFLVVLIVEAGIVAAFDNDISSLGARLVLQGLLALTLIATALLFASPDLRRFAPAADARAAAPGALAVRVDGDRVLRLHRRRDPDRGAAAARAGGRHPRPGLRRGPARFDRGRAADHRRGPAQRGDVLPRLHVPGPAPLRSVRGCGA